MSDIQSVLSYWFGGDESAAEVSALQSPLWWDKSAQVDRDIEHRFATEIDALVSGEREHWLTSAEGGWLRLLCWISSLAISIGIALGPLSRMTSRWSSVSKGSKTALTND